MRPSRPRLGVQLPIENLPDQAFGKGRELLVERRLGDGLHARDRPGKGKIRVDAVYRWLIFTMRTAYRKSRMSKHMTEKAILVFVFLLSVTARADTLVGEVVKVVDGDTLYVLDATKTRHKIRLSGIDTPERGQPFGAKAKQHLLELVGAKPVTVAWSKHDRYRRIVGKVLYENRDINLAMVRAGLAWWYRKYRDEQSPVDQALYEAAEDKARTERRGLWQDPNPVPPWAWRRR